YTYDRGRAGHRGWDRRLCGPRGREEPARHRHHYFFFFSSRRRHTRFSRDWSSDVCSSDLLSGRRRGHVDVAAPFTSGGRPGRLRVLPPRRHRRQRALGRAAPRRAAVKRSLALLAAVGFIAVLARAISDAVGPDGATPFVVVASFGVYVVTAELVLGRARSNRGPRTRAASGIAQWVPAFLWVPYAVVAYHVGPELAAPTPVFAAGIALTVLGIVFALWALATIGRHFDLEIEVHEDHEL